MPRHSKADALLKVQPSMDGQLSNIGTFISLHNLKAGEQVKESLPLRSPYCSYNTLEGRNLVALSGKFQEFSETCELFAY